MHPILLLLHIQTFCLKLVNYIYINTIMKIIANISCTDFSNIINMNQLLLSQIHYENLFKDYNKEMDYSRYFKYCNDDISKYFKQ